VRIALVNSNPDWGGGEQWFLDAMGALGERDHSLLLVARAGTKLYDEFDRAPYPTFDLATLQAGLAASRPEVVLCNTGSDVRRVVRAAGPQPPFRIVLRRGIDRPLHDNVFRRHFWKALTAILVNSDATGRTVRRSLPWFPADRIRRIYNPVAFTPLPRDENREASPSDPCAHPNPEHFRFGAAGRLVRQKGFDLLIEAFARVSSRLPCTLEIIGEGEERFHLERLCGNLGLGAGCLLIGHETQPARFYARIDGVVMPSRYEGFGYVAVEAALSGLPVIATSVSSLPEIVLEGVTGILVPPENVEALVAAMETLATSDDRGRALGEAGRTQAVRRFDPRRIHDQLEAFLAEAARLEPVHAVRVKA